MFNLKVKHLFYLVLILFYGFVLLRPIDLSSQDLGRHLANGREITQGNWSVLYQNHYSYTFPQQKFVNHHWLFGLTNYLIYQAAGFVGVHLFFILTALVFLILLLKLIKLQSNQFLTFLFGLIAVLFLANRTEIRPETLGWLFTAHSLYQLLQVITLKKLNQTQIIWLLVQQLVWVNWHISFVFGLALPGILWLSSNFLHSPQLNQKTRRKLLKLTLLLTLVSLFNPNHFWGLVQPVTIFADYGYTIVENQTLWFLWQVIRKPTIFTYLAISTTGLTLWCIDFFNKHQTKILNWFETIIMLIGLILGYLALRHLPLFIIFTFPMMAKLVKNLWNKLENKLGLELHPQQELVSLSLIYIPVILLTISGKLIPPIKISNRYLGQPSNQAHAAEFIRSQSLPTPIFNNYDIGSYLIFYLYPDIKVFTDNRPEAYTRDFFQKTYIPLQQKPKIWQQVKEKYQFQSVIFGVKDITPWGRAFLNFIEQQPDWNKVYQDQTVAIYVLNKI
jgi:hypothetical protein